MQKLTLLPRYIIIALISLGIVSNLSAGTASSKPITAEKTDHSIVEKQESSNEGEKTGLDITALQNLSNELLLKILFYKGVAKHLRLASKHFASLCSDPSLLLVMVIHDERSLNDYLKHDKISEYRIPNIAVRYTHINGKELQTLIEGNPNIARLSLYGCQRITDTSLQWISEHCHRLTHLDLSYTEVTDAGLKHLQQLPLLTLSLKHCNWWVTSASLKYLPKSITQLDLSECFNMCSPLLSHLNNLPLVKLSLNSCPSANNNVKYLQEIPLTELELGNASMTDESLQHLPKGLIKLNVSRGRKITGTGLQSIVTDHPNLIALNIGENDITDDSLQYLSSLENLTILNLSGCKNITGTGLEHLSHLKHLTTLDLTGTKITADNLKHLSSIESLTKLNLNRCHNITDESVELLPDRLIKLNLGWTQVTNDGLMHIIERCPNLTKLNLDGYGHTPLTTTGLKLLGGLPLTKLSIKGAEGLTHTDLKCVVSRCPQLRVLKLSGCTNINNNDLQCLLDLHNLQVLYAPGWKKSQGNQIPIYLYSLHVEELPYLPIELWGYILLQGNFSYEDKMKTKQICRAFNALVKSLHAWPQDLTEFCEEKYRKKPWEIKAIPILPKVKTSDLPILTPFAQMIWGMSIVPDELSLDNLNNFPSLRILDLQNCFNLIDMGFETLQNLKCLKSLNLSGCSVSNNILACLKEFPRLEMLDLNECTQFTQEGLLHLGELRNLKSLRLRKCNLGNGEFQAIAKNCPNITRLNLSETQVTDADLQYIPETITELSLRGCPNVTDTGLMYVLARCPNLTKLNLSAYNGIRSSGLEYLSKNCLNLTILKLKRCWEIPSPDFKCLLALPNLKTLCPSIGEKLRGNSIKEYLNKLDEKKEIPDDPSNCSLQ